MNLGPISQSLILAGESTEVDILVTRATPVVRSPAAAGQLALNERRTQGVALQFNSVDDEFFAMRGKSPVDLYKRVQRQNSPKIATQILDVFA